jgi:hypothetical protein
MDQEARALPAEMLQVIEVRALRDFHFGDRHVAIGDRLTMPRHRAEYARFLCLIELT